MTSDLLPLFFPNTPIGQRLLQISKAQRRLTPTTMSGMLKTSTPNGVMFRPLVQAKPVAAKAPAGSIQLVYLQSVSGSTLNCSTLPNNGGTQVQVAKASKLNHSIVSEAIEGDVISYAYATRPQNLDGQRTATDGVTGLTQIEIVIPVYIVNDPIFAITVPNPSGGANIVIDANIDGRAWCQVG